MKTKLQILIGSGIGIIFMLLVLFDIGFVLGAPQLLSLAQAGRFITIVILAPVLEEFGFRLILPMLLYHKVTRGRYLAVIGITSVVFSLFHVAVYGSLIDKSALFVSAIVFSAVMMLVLWALSRTSDPIEHWKYLPIVITAHAIINFGIFIKPLLAFATG